MKTAYTTFALSLAALVFSGCASIVSKSNWPVQLVSTPPGATVSVKDANGGEIFRGTTPTQVTLMSGRGYFKSAAYTLEFAKEGAQPQTVQLRASLNGWYIGNVVFGGLIGLVIVDPLTGAMYRFEDSVNVSLNPLASNLAPGDLRLVSIADIAQTDRARLVKIN